MDLSTLNEQLRTHGFDVTPDFSGAIQRFNRDDGKLNGWAVGETIDGKLLFSYGDWRTAEHHTWASEADLANDVTFQVHKQLVSVQKEADQELVALECEKIWDTLIPYGKHLYLDRKKLDGIYGARISGDSLYIPLRSISGKLYSLQKITPAGDKRFHPGGKIRGCFHTIGDFTNADRIFICEGFATGASVYLAFDKRWPVVCAMNAGNMLEVCLEIRRKYGSAEIIVCADNDSGTKGNPGRTKAEKAAREVGGRCVYPTFYSYDNNPTDFNDLHCREGLERVVGVIEKSLAERASEVVPLATKDKEGKKKRPAELQVVKALVDIHQDQLVKTHDDLYRFVGTHWKRLDENEENAIRHQIQKLSGGTYEHRHVQGAYNHFLTYIRNASEQIYTPKPFAANFKNGTLHLSLDKDFKPSYSFAPHNPADFITNTIGVDYGENLKTNDEFMQMLSRVFSGDEDASEKIRAVSQMYGACILPIYPHFFLLHGPTQTGKSTLILVASHLMAKENLCQVEPHEFSGFNLSSMVGKLVNVSTDIRVSQVIDDGNIKKICDRQNFRIDRKHKDSIEAPLPAIHIYGANGIPKTLDGSSGAHEKRWSFIEVNKFKAAGFYNKDYSLEVFNQCPEGVLKFAMEGLGDLFRDRGHYLNPASGKERLKEWELEHDVVGQFVQELCDGELMLLCLDPNGAVLRSKLGDEFGFWLDAQKARFRPSKFELFRQLKKKGFLDYKNNQVFIRGIALRGN